MGNTAEPEIPAEQSEQLLTLLRRDSLNNPFNSFLAPRRTTSSADFIAPTLINVEFELIYSGHEVFLAGEYWDNWATKLKMEKKEGKFVLITKLPLGKFQYKFVADGRWVCSTQQPQEADAQHNLNNVVTVKEVLMGGARPEPEPKSDSDDEGDAGDPPGKGPKTINNIEKILNKLSYGEPPKMIEVARIHKSFTRQEQKRELVRKPEALTAEECEDLDLIETLGVDTNLPWSVNL